MGRQMKFNIRIARQKEKERISKNLKRLMKRYNLSSLDISEAIDVSRSAVYIWLKAENLIASKYTWKLLKYFKRRGEFDLKITEFVSRH